MILFRDGVKVIEGNQFDILKYIHKTHSFSLDHALKHEGYSLSPLEEEYKHDETHSNH